MSRYLTILGLLLLMSCGVVDKTNSSVYLAGEIVNPTSKYLVLYKDDQLIDSAKIDLNNRFKIQFTALEDGLYHFYHEPEFNYVYLQKGDSLNLRLNTVAFDESLVFSGRGAEVNNFLIELFVQRENEERNSVQIYNYDPDTFSKQIERLRDQKTAMLDQLKSRVKLSSKAEELVRASIDYNTYIYKEKYPFLHKANQQERELHHLPKDFYAYRKEMKLDNRELYFYSPYYAYMKYQLGNLAYMRCRENCLQPVGANQILHFNIHKLEVIDSLEIDKRLKDNLNRNIAIQYYLKSRDPKENIIKFHDSFLNYAAANVHHDEIENVFHNILNLQPTLKLPRFELISYKGNLTSIEEIAQENQKVVLYFYSPNYESIFYQIQERVHSLEKKYPDYTFIGISTNDNTYQWKTLIDNSILNKTRQYYINPQTTIQSQLLIDSPYKSIILNNGIIEDAFANLFTSF